MNPSTAMVNYNWSCKKQLFMIINCCVLIFSILEMGHCTSSPFQQVLVMSNGKILVVTDGYGVSVILPITDPSVPGSSRQSSSVLLCHTRISGEQHHPLLIRGVDHLSSHVTLCSNDHCFHINTEDCTSTAIDVTNATATGAGFTTDDRGIYFTIEYRHYYRRISSDGVIIWWETVDSSSVTVESTAVPVESQSVPVKSTFVPISVSDESESVPVIVPVKPSSLSIEIFVSRQFLYISAVDSKDKWFLLKFKHEVATGFLLIYKVFLLQLSSIKEPHHISFGTTEDYKDGPPLLIMASGTDIKTLSIAAIEKYCQDSKVSCQDGGGTTIPRAEVPSLVNVKLSPPVAAVRDNSRVIGITTTTANGATFGTSTDRTNVLFIGVQRNSFHYIYEYRMLSSRKFRFISVRSLSHSIDTLIWNHYSNRLHCLINHSSEIIGYDYSLHKSKPRAIYHQLQISTSDIHHRLHRLYQPYYVSFVTSDRALLSTSQSMSIVIQSSLLVANRFISCCFYGTCDALECKEKLPFLCKSVGSWLLSSLMLSAGSNHFKIMFEHCSNHLSLNHGDSGLAANVSSNIRFNKRSAMATVTSVSPSTIIPAGGSIVNFIGNNFDSGNVHIVCGNKFFRMTCDHYNLTVISCRSPPLSTTTSCNHILYDDTLSVDLSAIGLTISPNPSIGTLSYTLDGSSLNVIITGNHFKSVTMSQITVFVGEDPCTSLSIQSNIVMSCVAKLTNSNIQKVSLNIVINMAGFRYSELIEYSSVDNGSNEGVPYVPIIVVIVILFAAFVALILGVVTASLWKRKHSRSTESQQMETIIVHEDDDRQQHLFSTIAQTENIYESVREYQQQKRGNQLELRLHEINNLKEEQTTVAVVSMDEQQYIPMHSATTTMDENNNIVNQSIPEYITMVGGSSGTGGGSTSAA